MIHWYGKMQCGIRVASEHRKMKYLETEPYISLDVYAEQWLSEANDPSWDECSVSENLEKQTHFSSDLKEATYNIPHDVLDENIQIMDKWKAYIVAMPGADVDVSQFLPQYNLDTPVFAIAILGTGKSLVVLTIPST